MERRVVIVTIGTELVLGETLDTNARWLSRELGDLGFRVVRHVSVPDDETAMVREIKRALSEGALVITSGGIGPTVDDRTRQAVAIALGVDLRLDHDELARLKDRYAASARAFPDGSEIQCMRPDGSELVPNAFGTASCFFATTDNAGVVALPGVPRELQGIWREELRPLLVDHFGVGGRWFERELRVFGYPEADLGNRLRDLLERDDVSASILPNDSVIRVCWRMQSDDEEKADALLDPIVADARSRLGTAIFSDRDESLADVVVRLATEQGRTLATVESCTGGRVAAALTGVAGSSAVFMDGAVTYSNAAKMRRVGVRQETLDTHGAVSEQTALEMATGMRESSDVDLSVATTGIAGPTGGSDDKPVGTVWFAVATRDTSRAWRLQVPGDRELVQWRSARAALNALRLTLLAGAPPDKISHWMTPPE